MFTWVGLLVSESVATVAVCYSLVMPFESLAPRVKPTGRLGFRVSRHQGVGWVDRIFLFVDFSRRLRGASQPAADLVSEADSGLPRGGCHQPHILMEERPGPLRSRPPPEARADVRIHPLRDHVEMLKVIRVLTGVGLRCVTCSDWHCLKWAARGQNESLFWSSV